MDVQKNEKSFPLSGLKILLAEDDEINRIVVSKILELRKVTVVCASDGFQAVRIFKENNDIDLILMDIQLPDKDGIQTTAEIKAIQQERGIKVPVIALTAYIAEGNREYFLSMGLDDYVTKPIDIPILISTIQKHISFIGK